VLILYRAVNKFGRIVVIRLRLLRNAIRVSSDATVGPQCSPLLVPSLEIPIDSYHGVLFLVSSIPSKQMAWTVFLNSLQIFASKFMSFTTDNLQGI
jgi:hypothetical protein